jgi:hypothetical protein
MINHFITHYYFNILNNFKLNYVIISIYVKFIYITDLYYDIIILNYFILIFILPFISHHFSFNYYTIIVINDVKYINF